MGMHRFVVGYAGHRETFAQRPFSKYETGNDARSIGSFSHYGYSSHQVNDAGQANEQIKEALEQSVRSHLPGRCTPYGVWWWRPRFGHTFWMTHHKNLRLIPFRSILKILLFLKRKYRICYRNDSNAIIIVTCCRKEFHVHFHPSLQAWICRVVMVSIPGSTEPQRDESRIVGCGRCLEVTLIFPADPARTIQHMPNVLMQAGEAANQSSLGWHTADGWYHLFLQDFSPFDSLSLGAMKKIYIWTILNDQPAFE